MITTLIGNYPKIAEGAYGTRLIGTISRWQRQEITDEELEQVYQDITRAILQEQEQAGIDLLTDGQIRWEDIVTPIARRLDGFEVNGLTRWFNNNVYYRRPILHRAPVRQGPILVQEYQFARSCTTRPVKAVLPGPYTVMAVSEDRYYKNPRRFVRRMAEILNEEARDLAAAGAPVIQFDDPAIGFGWPGGRHSSKAKTTDMKLALEGLQVATRGVKTKTAVVTYFGALNGRLSQLLNAPVDIIGVDVVSSPTTLAALKKLRRIPKALALGCLDARNTKLESVKDLRAVFRIASKLVPPDHLYVNPNCGLEFLPHRQALAKVQRLAEAARAFKES